MLKEMLEEVENKNEYVIAYYKKKTRNTLRRKRDIYYKNKKEKLFNDLHNERICQYPPYRRKKNHKGDFYYLKSSCNNKDFKKYSNKRIRHYKHDLKNGCMYKKENSKYGFYD